MAAESESTHSDSTRASSTRSAQVQPGQAQPGQARPAVTRPEPTPKQIAKWRRYLAEEQIEAQTYRNLAKREVGPERDIMLDLAAAEGRHEAHWRQLLGVHADPSPRPRLYSRVLSALAGRFGSVFTLALVQRSEQRSIYDYDLDATAQMAADEHIHGEVVRSLAAASRTKIAGNFRAAIFGANDGLISNLALILGVAGAGMDANWVVATGLAGLLAGSLSMAAGEWISVSSARELLDASIPDPLTPRSVKKLDVAENELALLFRARGESEEDAQAHARAVFASVGDASDDTGMIALDLIPASLRREEAGASGDIGSPVRVALSSFVFFAVGALVPLLPYLLGAEGISAVLWSSGIVGVALFFTGGLVGLISGRSTWRSALRQLAVGFGAAAITFLLGNLVGAIG